MKITGDATTREVFIDGKKLSPTKSQKLHNHSPDGFNWGYGGSGPSQLALAIMLECTDKEQALDLYHDFKSDFLEELEQSRNFIFLFNFKLFLEDLKEKKLW